MRGPEGASVRQRTEATRQRFASESSQGYPDHYGRYLEHFLGGRLWTEGWGTDGWEEARLPDIF